MNLTSILVLFFKLLVLFVWYEPLSDVEFPAKLAETVSDFRLILPCNKEKSRIHTCSGCCAPWDVVRKEDITMRITTKIGTHPSVAP